MSPPGIAEITAIIDYDEVYRAYLQSLVDTLRGFSAGLAGLELWVPHEDERLSLRNLLEVAAAAGRNTISVRFGAAHRPRIDPAAMREMAARFGRVEVTVTDHEIVVSVDDLHAYILAPDDGAVASSPIRERVRPTKPPAAATPPTSRPSTAYDHKLEQATHNIRHQIAARAAIQPQAVTSHPTSPNAIVVARGTADDGHQLLLQIDSATHLVVSAQFALSPDATSSSTAVFAPLLDRLCALAPGLPIIELGHHGVIRLEAALRDPNAPPALPGIVLPKTAHPMFALPAALLASALADYRTQTGYAETTTRFDDPPRADWLQSTLARRLGRVAAAIAPMLRERRLDPADVFPDAVEHDVRVVFALPDVLTSRERQRLLLDVEALIKRDVDPRLEIFAEERKDRNQLRRLAVVKPSKPAAQPGKQAS